MKKRRQIIGDSGEKTVPKFEEFAEKKLGISLSVLETMIQEIDDEVKKAQEFLFG